MSLTDPGAGNDVVAVQSGESSPGANTTIVAFVGDNENGILRHLSHQLMELLRPHGFHGCVIDLHDPSWLNQLDAALKKGVFMAWGHAGVGAKLEKEGQCFWDLAKVPFVSVLADPPCARPCNHAITSNYVANAYLYPEWLRVQQRFIKSRQLSVLVQGGIVPNRHRDDIAWARRPRRMVLVKTGADAQARRAAWKDLSRRMRSILEDAAAIAVNQPTGDVTDILIGAVEANGMMLDGRTDILFALMTELDTYVRDARSTALVSALLDVPADIYGSGWDHLKDGATRARFHPAFDADAMPQIYAEAQFMLNTTPNFSSGVHERVAYGLDARCCVVSDENQFMQTHLSGIPTFLGIDPRDPALGERLRAIYNDPTDYTDAAQPALDLVAREFSGLRYMLSLLELAQEIRLEDRFMGYRH